MTAPPYTVPNVPSGRFYVRVRGRNEFGTGPESNEHVLVVDPVTGNAPPGPPGALTATLTGGPTICALTMTWEPSGTGSPATEYQVEAGSRPGLADIAALRVSAPAFSYGAVPRGLYYLRVRGVNAAGPGLVASNEVRLNCGNVTEPPNAPQNLAATVSGSTVTFTWTPPAVTGNNAATGYVIEAGSATGLANLATAPVTGTSRSFSGVPPGTYFVRVKAVNGAGSSGSSNEVTVTVR
jgi:predicted phage tail protein